MALRLRGISKEGLPEHGWGVIGEALGDASTKTLKTVLPLEEKDKARTMAAELEAERAEGLSWFSSRVSLIGERPDEAGGTAVVYVEASDLTHPAQKAA